MGAWDGALCGRRIASTLAYALCPPLAALYHAVGRARGGAKCVTGVLSQASATRAQRCVRRAMVARMKCRLAVVFPAMLYALIRGQEHAPMGAQGHRFRQALLR